MAEREGAVDNCLVYVNQGFNLLEELVRHRFTDDKRLAELMVIRCEEFVYGLIILDRLTLWSEEVHGRFQTVIECFNEQVGIINERFCFFEEDEDQYYQCPYENNEDGSRIRGRPRFLIPKAQLEGLRSLHFTWNKIAQMLGVSERTIRRRREELGMNVGQTDAYSDIPDDDLDILVSRILHFSPNSGERMLLGAIRSHGVKVQRERMRNSIRRVDPISRDLRRRTSIHRRVYSVRTPNALW